MILKLLPDTVVPLLGKDSVDERRVEAAQQGGNARNDPRYAQVQQKWAERARKLKTNDTNIRASQYEKERKLC